MVQLVIAEPVALFSEGLLDQVVRLVIQILSEVTEPTQRFIRLEPYLLGARHYQRLR